MNPASGSPGRGFFITQIFRPQNILPNSTCSLSKMGQL